MGERWIDRLTEFDILITTSLIWFLGQFVRYTFPPLFDLFRDLYGVSNTTLGGLFTVLLFMYAGTQFPSGALADRIGMARVITGGAVVLSAAAVLLFLWQGFPALVVGMALIGIGSGAHKTVAINLLSVVYPGRTGRTLGVMDAIGQLGGVAAPATVVFVLTLPVDWNVTFLAVALVGITLAVGFVERTRHRDILDPVGGSFGASGGDLFGGYLAALMNPRFAVFAVVAVGFTFTWSGVSAFLPLYLVSEKGLTAPTAGLLYTVVFLASLVQPLTGAIADRVGRLPVALGTLGMATMGLLALLVAQRLGTLTLIVLAIGLGLHGFRPARDAFLVETIPAGVGGGTLGIVRTVMMILGSAAPTVVGSVSDIASFSMAFGILAVTLAIGTSLTVGLLAAPQTVSRTF